MNQSFVWSSKRKSPSGISFLTESIIFLNASLGKRRVKRNPAKLPEDVSTVFSSLIVSVRSVCSVISKTRTERNQDNILRKLVNLHAIQITREFKSIIVNEDKPFNQVFLHPKEPNRWRGEARTEDLFGFGAESF